MTRKDIDAVYPLSPLQQGILFHSVDAADAAHYIAQIAYRIRGSLDPSAFEEAWRRAMHRYAPLRTAFVWEGLDEPLQVVGSSVKVPLERFDWRDLSVEARSRATAELTREQGARGFRLTEAPLMRLALAQVSDDEHHFLWTHHHVLLDGWSVRLVLKDVLAFYEGLTNGGVPSLEQVRPFSEYIQWLARRDREPAERYWRESLQGFTAPTPLPLETREAAVAGGAAAPGTADAGTADAGEHEAGCQRLRLSTERRAAIEAFARRHQFTPHTLVQAAWAFLLSRYSGESDVLFGEIVSGRPADLDGAESMAGLFINTVPVRVAVPDAMPVRRWLADLQSRQLQRLDHAFSPLASMRGWSDVPPDEPLFRTLLVFENFPASSQAGGGASEGTLQIREVPSAEQTSHYALVLVASMGAEFRLRLDYDARAFEAATIARMLDHLDQVLGELVSAADRPVASLSLFTPAERVEVVEEWGRGPAMAIETPCVTDLFEAQVRRTPDAVAVTCAGQALTYRELDARANALACELQRRGVGVEERVGVCLDRSVDLMIALLGVWKAGASYVPLEPGLPATRRAFMRADAAARLVVTNARWRTAAVECGGEAIELPPRPDRVATAPRPGARAASLPLERHVGPAEPLRGVQSHGRQEGETLLDSVESMARLAYVLYTSGSTGTPKGVMVSHGAVANYLAWSAAAYAGPRADSIVHTSVGFDLTVTSLFAPLLRGGTVVLVPAGEDIEGFARVVSEAPGIGLVKLTPSHLPLLVPHAGGAAWAERTIVLGGEAVRGEQLRSWQDAAPGLRVINEYGPTEATVGCCVYDVPSPAPSGAVPIGRPIANTCLHVVDPWGQPASVGVAGELCIGGAGLARGYVGQPAGTAERFVPDAWSGTTGARVYRTGDRARWRADGQLEFLGRWDHQVKVRGYRIELGEVEAALGQCDGVREAIAVARPSPIDGDGDGEGEGHVRLLAYVVTDGRPVAAVREALATRLPAYMIPSAIVPLERLPLTANGKIDRAALPSPDDDPRHGEPSLSSTGLTPREELIAAIWADVLGVTSVHRDDDFFVLGGHSLLATRVVSRVRRLLHVDVSLRALLTMRTLAEFAGEVERAQRGAEGLTNAPIVPMPRQPLNPLSFQQQRLWFVDRLDPHRASYNIVAARRLDGVLDIAALRHAVDEVVRRHEILRTHFRAEDGEPFQVVEPHHGAVVPVIDLRGIEGATAREAEARRIADEHARRPFDLTRTPLLRFTLLRLADTSHVVLVTLHHIIGDGWSMQLLIYEIAVLYGAFTQGARSPLPELPLQYADYAIWQRQWLQGGVLERQLAYWTQRLHGAPPYLDILDAAAGRTVVDGGRQIQFEISADTADRVRALGRAQGTTVFMTLLAAFQALLSRYTGREDIVVGTDVAGRTRGETEDLIGLFVNQLVMRTDLSGNPRFIEAIGRVRDVALGAYVHQDLPFERLVEALQPERRAGRNPLFQVMFILQNIPPRDLTNVTRELAIGPFGADSDTTAFDMTLSIADRGTGAMPGSVRFNTRLFAPTTMERLTRDLNAMVAAGVEQPETRIGDIPLETPEEQRDEAAARRERREEKFRKLAAVKPRKLQLSSEQAVTMTPIAAGSALPLMVQPGVDGVDVAAWAASHRELIESRLLEHGGLLFRGFGVASVADFERFTKAMCPGLVEYGERSSPRSRVASGVYTSTDHPKTERILLHNEQSYTLHWPMKIWFGCLQAARQGGSTPIADSRKILQRLDPGIVAAFERKQIMYVRNYGSGLGLSWREAFQTSDRREVEAHCARESIACVWRGDDGLRTEQRRPAVRAHPKTGEPIWFNHALFFHPSSLDPAALEAIRAVVAEQDMPFNTLYGDGSSIEPSVLDEVRHAYDAETVRFEWRTGDVLMLDNMLACHGRDPFDGPRTVVVAMGEPVTHEPVLVASASASAHS